MTGQYQFPFTFKLPDYLPGSFHRQDGPCFIEYQIVGIAMTGVKKIKDLESRAGIVIQEKMDNILNSANEVQIINSMNCCEEKGRTSIYYHVDKNYLSVGEEYIVYFKLDNQNCTSAISHTEVMIKRRTILTTQQAHRIENSSKTVSIVRVRTNLTAGELSNDYGAQMFIPPKCATMSTTTGRLIKSRYSLTIRPIYTDFFCCTPTDATQFPLILHHPQLPPLVLPVPANWAPQLHGSSILSNTLPQHLDHQNPYLLQPVQMEEHNLNHPDTLHNDTPDNLPDYYVPID